MLQIIAFAITIPTFATWNAILS